MSDTGSVTQRAYETLQDDSLIKERFATPGDVLEHLTHGKEFKTLADNLKEAMISAGLCTEDSPENDYINILYKRLKVLEDSIPDTEPDLTGASDYLDKHIKSIFKKTSTARETIKRRLTGKTHRTNDYNDLIKICFALELDLPIATDFLNKSGFNSFNIRNPLDAIYIYCILNKRPFITALDLFVKYLHAPCIPSAEESAAQPYDGHSTTRQLENAILKNSDWESDESFLNTFLIPHKEMFTEYSKTTFAEYERIKNPFFLTAAKLSIDEEAEAVGRKIISDHKRKAHKRKYGELLEQEVNKTDTRVTYAMRTALKKHAGDNAFMQMLADKSELGIASDSAGHIHIKNNLAAICDEIGNYMKENRGNRAVQYELAHFLPDVIGEDYCLFKMLPSVIGSDTRKKAFKSSDLSNTVLFLFPHRQPLARYEKQPASIGNGVYIRKAIILMYYFAFAYEFSAENPGSTYFADIFCEYDFPTFIEEVNAALARCRFAPLYPANRFDWLILRSIRQFEICEPDEDLTECITFFNDVLEASFHEDAAERTDF